MRKLVPILLIVVVGIIFIARLFYMQILDDSFSKLSQTNAVKVEYDYPQRGYIFDRNGKLLVANQPSYDVMVVPREVTAFDTLEFAKLLGIDEIQLKKSLKKARVYSSRLPSVVIPQLTKNEYAYLQEKLRKYSGFYIQKRSLRDYKTKTGSNVLGYIAEVNPREISANPYYNSGDLTGRQGVEKQYEKLLRGVKGVKYLQKDRFNREIGPYKNGIYDTLPVKGKDISLTIDEKLQAYGQMLMTNKHGGIVAIEPQTGEILSLVTAPSYDPALLVGRKRSKNFTKLWYDTINKPLLDRGLQAMYPPGSPFKALTALIALQEGVINTKETMACHMGFSYGRRSRMGCHYHKSPVSLVPALAQSCNTYFAKAYWRTIENYPTAPKGMDAWQKHLKSFGLGDFLGYDLPIGQPGRIPDGDYYNRWYPDIRWAASYTLSNGIGQGEIATTPIQLANITAAIANRGWYYTPHVLKSIEGNPIKDTMYTKKRYTTIDTKHFEPIVEGMHGVYNYGTARSLRIPGVEICGKTGTAENFTRIDGKRVQLTDHSIFVAFAPKDDPKIALAVFVENGYWGSRYGGRIASLMIEKYLNDTITRKDLEKWVMSHSLEEEYLKPYSGESFKINQ
ncbi:penicillin-binding protein 2 [Mesonia hippocampi]|uniref:Penicillin-binding protein 2 n=1 Tax=Mesonia hippocampi TaxID=1628250 RepID=A0A840ERS1_9FLAO|nr:penicillin-binding protein 2 [Mesonia hippocampi]MBB4119670.1 penicillin-binding protein 2 [Mesonia hippocampi]